MSACRTQGADSCRSADALAVSDGSLHANAPSAPRLSMLPFAQGASFGKS